MITRQKAEMTYIIVLGPGVNGLDVPRQFTYSLCVTQGLIIWERPAKPCSALDGVISTAMIGFFNRVLTEDGKC